MKFCLLFVAMNFLLFGCAQTKKAIFASHAFFKQSFAGARLTSTDSNGNETEKAPDTIHSIFIKVEKNKGVLVVDSVFIGEKQYKAFPLPMENELLVGTTRFGNKPVYLAHTKNRIWYQLQLIPLSKSTGYQADKKIFVKGFLDKQPFRLTIENEIELLPDVRM